MKPTHFGVHLTFDGYGGSYDKLNDEKLVRQVLFDLPNVLGMNLLAPPQVFFAAGKVKDPGGWSGFVVIQESHISLHTFPAKGFLSADVYTCQNELAQNTVIEYLSKVFEIKKTETNLIIRGTMYSQNEIH